MKAAAAQPTGKLGKNLCGFGDLPPAEAEPEPTLRAFSVRLWNENEELDDAFTVTVTGPNGLSEAFYWDGGPLNDTTFGPYSGEAGAYHIVGVVSEDHGNGNYFIVEITAADPSETLSYTYISTAGFEFDFTLPPSP